MAASRSVGRVPRFGAGEWVLNRDSLREALVVFGVGLVAGALAAFVAVRLTSSLVADLLFGLTATDAANLLAAISVMVVAALAACTLPALRATRIDPLLCIRED